MEALTGSPAALVIGCVIANDRAPKIRGFFDTIFSALIWYDDNETNTVSDIELMSNQYLYFHYSYAARIVSKALLNR